MNETRLIGEFDSFGTEFGVSGVNVIDTKIQSRPGGGLLKKHAHTRKCKKGQAGRVVLLQIARAKGVSVEGDRLVKILRVVVSSARLNVSSRFGTSPMFSQTYFGSSEYVTPLSTRNVTGSSRSFGPRTVPSI